MSEPEKIKAWLEANSRSDKAALSGMLRAGFELVEVGGEVALVWGEDAVRLLAAVERQVDEAVVAVEGESKGKIAYYRRMAGAGWAEIGERVGNGRHGALIVAKAYAESRGLAWPVPCGTALVAEK